MQRGSYVIAVSPDAVEGGLVARGESQPAFVQSVLQPANGTPRGEHARTLLEAFLDRAEWERGMALLVLPTEDVSVRNLHFAFSDPKKIRQALPFELQGELLDSLERYAYDVAILPQADGSAEVLVYLVEQDTLQDLLGPLERHNLTVHRATFSAQALAQAHPHPAGAHVYVYAGLDEAFVAYALDGHLRSVQTLSAVSGKLLPTLPGLAEHGPGRSLRSLLTDPEPDEERQALRARFHERLQAACTEVNRFLRINGSGGAYSVSSHGLLGELLHWNEDTGAFTLSPPDSGWLTAARSHFGVLGALLTNPRNVVAGRGPNFFRRVGTWTAVLRELKWPLAVTGILLALLAGVVGTSLHLRTAALTEQLAAQEQALLELLRIPGPLNTVAVNAALANLQGELNALREEREARAYLETYHFDTLKLLRNLSQIYRRHPQLTVDALTLNRERFALSGTTREYADTEALKSRIGALPNFEGRTVKVTHSRAGQQIRYRLIVER